MHYKTPIMIFQNIRNQTKKMSKLKIRKFGVKNIRKLIKKKIIK